MDVRQILIYQFLEGSGKSFVIPVYQRDYAWKKENCQKLWNDIEGLADQNRVDHFLGTLVTIGNEAFQAYTVIDGQQRLTTVSIFLKALHAHLASLDNAKQSPDDAVLEERILNDYLIDKYSKDDDQKIRLKPNKQDREHFEQLFKAADFKSDSNIVANFYFFRSQIENSLLTPEALFEAFKKLKIVLINLDRDKDNPQLIFESLNSTGVDLTAGDLIRNYVLMDLEPDLQDSYYNEYWIQIKNNTGDIAEFVRMYLVFRLRTSIKRSDVYPSFKSYVEEQFKGDKHEILVELLRFAKVYSTFVQINSHENSEIDRQLARLHSLEFTVCYPFLFDVFNDMEKGTFGVQTVVQILKTVESHAFRKMLVDNTTQGLNKMYASLSREIKKEPTWRKHYLDVFNFLISTKQVTQRFPSDDEFVRALTNREVYRLKAKNRNFLLASLENHNTPYQIVSENLSVEHIMPVTLTKKWKAQLGKRSEDIHKKYLHTLGNLTLTAKNSELSNHTLDAKQKIDYKTSKIKLNQGLPALTKWNKKTILDRAKVLSEEALEIWAYPKTNYSRPVVEETFFDLTSEDSFSNLKLSRLLLGQDDSGQKVTYWRDMLRIVCEHLYAYSPTEFNQLQKRSDFDRYFNQDRPLNSPLEFKKDNFIEGNLSALTVL